MRAFGSNAGTVILPGAALLLGGWFAYGLITEPGTESRSAPGPGLEPELVGAGGWHAQDRSRSDVVEPGTTGTQSMAAEARVVMPVTAAGPAAVARDQPDPAPVGFSLLLDRVFAPGRAASAPASGAARAMGDGGTERSAGARPPVRGGAPLPTASAPTADGEGQEARSRINAQTEKAYHERFTAVAAQDVHELEDQAAVVLREDGEDCKKVAMLRVLYATDRVRALDWFAQVIASLPDRPRPEGDSVPAFAVGYLGRRLDDAAVKGVVEQIACARGGNLSPNLQRIAAQALLATATAADLQRYAPYPAFEAVAAADLGGSR